MKLERFIRDNKEAFDTQEPSDELWNKISQKLPHHNGKVVEMGKLGHIVHEDYRNGGKKNPLMFLLMGHWRMAAAVVLAFGLGYSAYRLNDQYQITQEPQIVFTSPNLAKQVNQYTTLIENKRIELHQLSESDPELYRQFANELNELEGSYQNLKADLPKNPNPETLIQAMIQNLQLQIEIQNQQLQIIQKIKQPKNNEKYSKNII